MGLDSQFEAALELSVSVVIAVVGAASFALHNAVSHVPCFSFSGRQNENKGTKNQSKANLERKIMLYEKTNRILLFWALHRL
jgi:hypothetical protein